MIKTTLGKLYHSTIPMSSLMGQKLPIKQAYAIAKMADKINTELKIFNEKLAELSKSVAELNPDNPDEIKIPENKVEEFNKAANELAEIETNLDLNPITLDILEKAEITAGDIGILIEAGIVVE